MATKDLNDSVLSLSDPQNLSQRWEPPQSTSDFRPCYEATGFSLELTTVRSAISILVLSLLLPACATKGPSQQSGTRFQMPGPTAPGFGSSLA